MSKWIAVYRATFGVLFFVEFEGNSHGEVEAEALILGHKLGYTLIRVDESNPSQGGFF